MKRQEQQGLSQLSHVVFALILHLNLDELKFISKCYYLSIALIYKHSVRLSDRLNRRPILTMCQRHLFN